MNILIAGGSGTIGRSLTQYLQNEGHMVRILSRAVRNKAAGVYHWNPKHEIIDSDALQDCDVVINLCGAAILPKLWTKKRKQQLYNSRIQSTSFIAQQIKDTRVKHYIQISAVGIYGDTGDRITDEDSPYGQDFLAMLSQDWEDAAKIEDSVEPHILRLGLFFDADSGYYAINKRLARFGLCTGFGTGQQYICYTHIDEFKRLISSILTGHVVAGTYNAVSASPIRLKKFVSVISRFRMLPFVPKVLMRFAIGETAEPLLFSNRVITKHKAIRELHIYSDHLSAFKALEAH